MLSNLCLCVLIVYFQLDINNNYAVKPINWSTAGEYYTICHAARMAGQEQFCINVHNKNMFAKLEVRGL